MPEALPAPPSPGSTLVGTRLLEEWIEAQSHGATASCAIVAEACVVRGHQLVMQWRGKNAKRPAPRHWPVLERVCGIPPLSWETWEKLGPDEAPPESGPRETILPELGKTPDEIRESVRRSKALLAKGKLSPTQHAAIEGKILSGLGALARLEERQKLEDHPEFEAFADLVHIALERTLRQFGVEPTGARTVFADHLEAAEVEQQKRAA
jgi:hypothetical protein